MISIDLIKLYVNPILHSLRSFGGEATTEKLIESLSRHQSLFKRNQQLTQSYRQSVSEKSMSLALFCLYRTGYIRYSRGVWFLTPKATKVYRLSERGVYLVIRSADPQEKDENFLLRFLIQPDDFRPEISFSRASNVTKNRGESKFRNKEAEYETRTETEGEELAYAAELELNEFAFAEPPQEELQDEKRYVNCEIFKNKYPTDAVRRLEKNCDYQALIFIAPDTNVRTIRADIPLKESQLPPSKLGHDLQIVFCPLSNSKVKNQVTAPEIKTIFLPRLGKSDSAYFNFNSEIFGNEFRARILVVHQNRILQTLVLAAPNVDSELELRQENLISPLFFSTDAEKQIDIGLLINDNLAGIPGITAISSGRASFSEPQGLEDTINTIKTLLSQTNIEIAQEDVDLENPDLLSLLIQLAHQGAILMRELNRQLDINILKSAERIQIVEAKTKSYLPVEFVYTSNTPKIDAKICPNAKKSLEENGNIIHKECEYANNKDYVCPSAFWGFSKCIERHPSGGSEDHIFSIPQPGNNKLNPFNAALLAVSKRVAEDDVTGEDGVLPTIEKLVNNKNVRLAKSWADWQLNINLEPEASLLVLLPHSDNSPDFLNIPALEVQGKWLAASEFDSSYVLPNTKVSLGPIVFLLGCSTALTDIAYLNFVREFKASGASIVIGTLATIHGKHASKFVRSFLESLKLKNSNGRPFDEILLDVKCEMLSKGDCLVLSLVAYGNSSWQIQT